ncbi:MAG: CBS domain-containing protein [Nitrospirales bacterium]
MKKKKRAKARPRTRLASRTRVSSRSRPSSRRKGAGKRAASRVTKAKSKPKATRAGGRPVRRLSLDRNIERFRHQLDRLTPFLSTTKGQAWYSLDEFDLETERLIMEVFGESSQMVGAYDYAQLGEAGGLVNFPDEAPEGGSGTRDDLRESLNQRKRVLESCISELEARRAEENRNKPLATQAVIGPQVADYMAPQIRSVGADASLQEASRLMQKWQVGSLLVSNGRDYIGIITDTDLARGVVAQGLNSATTLVRTCMRKPPVTIEGDQPIIEGVRLMKEKGTRHLAVTEGGNIIGVISVSNILRYYSGVA